MPFDDFFDFDNDGKLDGFERLAEDVFFMQLVSDMEKRETLENAGIDPDEFDCMSDCEREQILEEAGLDPEGYEF